MNETNKKVNSRGEPKEYQLIIEVLGKKKDKSSSGNWAGKPFFRLKVKVEKPDEHKWVNEIMAFEERIEKEEIWKEIMADDYFDKRKLAVCSKYNKSFSLIRWTDRPLGGGE